MENSQYDLCIEVLHRLDKAGILKDIVLVGSWCTLFYKKFFSGKKYMTSLTTRDLDLLIPQPRTMKAKADVAELLKDLGFVVGFTGSQGYIRLEHPQLIVEFLVPDEAHCVSMWGHDFRLEYRQLGSLAENKSTTSRLVNSHAPVG